MPTEPLTNTAEGNKDAPRYIRTFAKDYQALSGNLPDSKQKGNKHSKAPKPPKEKKIKPKKEKPVKKIKEKKVKEQKPSKPIQAPIQVPISAPIPAAPIPVAEISIPQPEPIQQKTEAFALAERLSTPASPSIPLPTTPTPPPSIPKQIPVPIPPRPTGPAPLKTYSNDFASRIDTTKASSFSVLAAEKDAHPAKSPKKKNRALPVARILVIILFLIIIGAGGGFIFYMLTNTRIPISTPLSPSYLIPVTNSIELTGTGMSLREAFADSVNQPIPANSAVAVYVNQATTTAQGTIESPASGGAFISALDLAAPDILLRNIDPSSMVGILQAGTQTQPFFILRVTSYEGTYAGMLQWEPTMLQDIAPLYPLYPAVTTTSISSSTASDAGTALDNSNEPQTQFTDELVAGLSVRALKDMSGHTILLYGYADRQTLMIARDENAFQLLLSKLAPSS